MNVRRAVPADARAIAEVHVRSWQAGYRGLMPDQLLDGLSADDREPAWREAAAGQAGSGALFVADHDGALIGFCAVAEPTRDEDQPAGVAEIGAIYIDPDAWRIGAGTALLGTALDHLRAQRWREVTLWVLEGNQQALDFYAAFGFTPDGTRKPYHGSGTIGMRLRRSLPD